MTRMNERLEAGQKIRDVQTNNVGVVLDFACQYAHPKADPVYSYLVRWGDGQVQALDAKMNFDDNALFRQKAIAELRDEDEEEPSALEA